MPLHANLATVRISDVRMAMELMEVDVSGPVADYCATHPTIDPCILFRDGFED